jgi:CRP/FNR family transcriptional regulator, anaerobic regulatory protein
MLSLIHKIDLQTAFGEKIKSSFAPLLPFEKQRKIDKGSFIVESGEPCNKVFLIQEGVFRTYRQSDEIEYTTSFTPLLLCLPDASN